MNKLKTFLCGFAFAIAGTVSAQTMTFGDVDLTTGDTDTLKVCLTTETPMAAWQMKFYLPKGLTIAKDQTGERWKCSLSADYTKDFLLGVSPEASKGAPEDGCYTIICFSKDRSKTFVGENTELVSITFQADATYSKESPILVSDIHLSDRTAKNYHMGNVEITNETTGIRDMRAVNISAELYSLSGQRVVGMPQKGIYIRNGKKIIIK